jgi:hypothetical protein
VRLRSFQTPAVARVCRQLRVEALPIFFAINLFVAEVRTPIELTHLEYEGYVYVHYLAASDPRLKQVGKIQLTDDAAAFFDVHKGLRIRNLDLVLERFTYEVEWYITRKNFDHHHSAMVSMRSSPGLQKQSSSVVIDQTDKPHYSGNRWEEYVKDLEYLTAPGKEYLDQKCAESDSKGLSIIEIQQLASTVCVAPRPGRDMTKIENEIRILTQEYI